MKPLLILIIASLIASCSSSPKNPIFPAAAAVKSDQNTLFEGCSMIDVTLSEMWVLLCKKAPHLSRPELYEYSPLFKTFKRLTFQDGWISDFVVTGVDDIIYSSTYDESKEQFLAVAKGAVPGSDLYLKKRSQNEFTRLTKEPGSDQFLFWSQATQSLFFSHTNTRGSQIKQYTKDKKVLTHASSNTETLYSPLLLGTRDLYWLSWNETTKKSALIKKTMGMQAAASTLFQSATRLLVVRPSLKPNEILMTFSTGLGTELWSYGLSDACWKPVLQTQSKWNRFTFLDEESLYITADEQIKKMDLNKKDQACMPHPTGLGVEPKL